MSSRRRLGYLTQSNMYLHVPLHPSHEPIFTLLPLLPPPFPNTPVLGITLHLWCHVRFHKHVIKAFTHWPLEAALANFSGYLGYITISRKRLNRQRYTFSEDRRVKPPHTVLLCNMTS